MKTATTQQRSGLSDELLTTDQVLGLIHRDRTSLHRWVTEGKFPPPVRKGAGLYSLNAVNAWLAGTWEPDNA